MNPLTSLIAASIAFVGSHFAMSHPLRSALVERLGRFGFMALYTLVSFLTLGWMVAAFVAAPAGDLPSTGLAGWIVATLLTLPAAILLGGSFAGNPAFPQPGADRLATGKTPRGVFRVTRHPMMWGVALWAVAHIVLWWDWRSVIFAAALLILALVGSHLQDCKKRALMGDAWAKWEARTSYWPRWGALFRVGIVWWLVGLVLWLAFTYAHIHAGGIPAGIWRWV